MKLFVLAAVGLMCSAAVITHETEKTAFAGQEVTFNGKIEVNTLTNIFTQEVRWDSPFITESVFQYPLSMTETYIGPFLKVKLAPETLSGVYEGMVLIRYADITGLRAHASDMKINVPSNPVPEPGTFLVVAPFLLALLLRMRKYGRQLSH